MAGWFGALSKTRNLIGKAFGISASEREDLSEEEIEELLLRSDVPARLAMEIAEELSGGLFRRKSRRERLRERLLEALGERTTFEWPASPRPFATLLVGVNGAGKTTTAAKLAKRAKRAGLKPLLCGADTFRAAGSSQLGLWSERLDCAFVGGEMGADAAGVAYRAAERARAEGLDALLVDTAGRMHTRKPLMDELPKTCRALGKCLDGAPHAIWMVLDASLGRNAVVQARRFDEVVPLSGIVVTKLDGSSKAGFLFSVRSELNVPVLFVGLGEGEDDLVPFDPEAFVDAFLGEEEGGEAAEA